MSGARVRQYRSVFDISTLFEQIEYRMVWDSGRCGSDSDSDMIMILCDNNYSLYKYKYCSTSERIMIAFLFLGEAGI